MLVTFDTANLSDVAKVKELLASMEPRKPACQAPPHIAHPGDATPITETKVTGKRRASPSHLTCDEVAIIDHIKKGVTSAAQLRRDLKMKANAWGYHINRLRRMGLVQMSGKTAATQYTVPD
jgi:hypothetical protein